MTKQEAMRRTMMDATLRSIGFTRDECDALRRISLTLHNWHERECGTDNGCIERDEVTGKAYWLNSYSGKRYAIRDMESGAQKRLDAIIAKRNARIENPQSKDAEQFIHATCHAILSGKVTAYIQGDPRGAALYILRPGDIPAGQTADSCYSRGVCVY